MFDDLLNQIHFSFLLSGGLRHLLRNPLRGGGLFFFQWSNTGGITFLIASYTGVRRVVTVAEHDPYISPVRARQATQLAHGANAGSNT